MYQRVLIVAAFLGLAALASATSSLYEVPNELKYDWEILEKSSPSRYFGSYHTYLLHKEYHQGAPTYEWPLPGFNDKNYILFYAGMIPMAHDEGSLINTENSQAMVPISNYLLPSDTPSCIFRVDGWWSYELCFGKHLRQFHQETDTRISAEYYLGKADPKDLPLLGPEGYTEKFTGGTKCDLTGALRSTQVIYRCSSAALSVTFTELREPSTCSYAVYVDTPSLCNHPKFRPKAEKVPLKVSCFETPLPESREVEAALVEYNLNVKAQAKPSAPSASPTITPPGETSSASHSKDPSSGTPSEAPSDPTPTPTSLPPSRHINKKKKANDAEKMQYMTMLQSRLHALGIAPKTLGNEFLDHLYNLYGSKTEFSWVNHGNIKTLQRDYRELKLNEHLEKIDAKTPLYDDELEEIFGRLHEGKYNFDWLTQEVLEDIMDIVSARKKAKAEGGTVVTSEMFDIVSKAADAVLATKGLDVDKFTDDDIEFLVATVEASQLPTVDLKSDPTFISLINSLLAVTPEEIERREAQLERKMAEYGYELADFDPAQLQRVLKLGKVTFEVLDEEGGQKIIYVDLDKDTAEEEPGHQRKPKKVDEDFDEL